MGDHWGRRKVVDAGDKAADHEMYLITKVEFKKAHWFTVRYAHAQCLNINPQAPANFTGVRWSLWPNTIPEIILNSTGTYSQNRRGIMQLRNEHPVHSTNDHCNQDQLPKFRTGYNKTISHKSLFRGNFKPTQCFKWASMAPSLGIELATFHTISKHSQFLMIFHFPL